MQIVHVSTADLAAKAAPYNPRKIGDHDLAALRRSLKFFGTVEPVVVNQRSGHIVGGHQRVRAAEAEGIDTLPVVYVDLDDPSERQLNLALNRISGEFDTEKLAAVLAELEAAGADMALTGFSDTEIDELLRGGEAPVDGLTDPDAIPEPPDEPPLENPPPPRRFE
jgi:ParB-like chromosome segregation protein Spo0J